MRNSSGTGRRWLRGGRAARTALACLGCAAAAAQQRGTGYPPQMEGAQVEVYKTVGEVKLNMYIFNPPGHQAGDRRAAMAFFFGGGWRGGTPQQFEQQCRHLAARGMVAMAADYRVATRHAAKVVDCVRDAKSAIRWVRQNARRLGIDPVRIAARGRLGGRSLGGCGGRDRRAG